MSEPVEHLILDLLEWIGPRPRPYAEVMEAWRTSCPRLPVWEEANGRGFIEHLHPPGSEAHVAVTAQGQAHLKALRKQADSPAGAATLTAEPADPASVPYAPARAGTASACRASA